MSTVTYLEAIRDGLREEMLRDQNVFVLGEDVGVYGGAFKVTEGFLSEFGEQRVVDTPLSESAIVGAAIGAALMGMKPVAEMQFADFISCAFDQITNFAAIYINSRDNNYFINQILIQQKFDLIHYEMFHAAQYALPTNLPTVLSTQNVDSYIWKRLGQETGNPIKKLIYWTQAQAFNRYERTNSGKFSVATCVSDNDQILLNRDCPQLPVRVIANGVDLELYQATETIEEPETLIYTGSMDWYPNEDAVIFFLKFSRLLLLPYRDQGP